MCGGWLGWVCEEGKCGGWWGWLCEGVSVGAAV